MQFREYLSTYKALLFSWRLGKMNLEEALNEIERLNQIIAEKDKEIEGLRKKKNAGRKKNNEQWQTSYNAFVELYEQGIPMVEIVERSECSRRTCYRYKEYYDNLNKLEK